MTPYPFAFMRRKARAIWARLASRFAYERRHLRLRRDFPTCTDRAPRGRRHRPGLRRRRRFGEIVHGDQTIAATTGRPRTWPAVPEQRCGGAMTSRSARSCTMLSSRVTGSPRSRQVARDRGHACVETPEQRGNERETGRVQEEGPLTDKIFALQDAAMARDWRSTSPYVQRAS